MAYESLLYTSTKVLLYSRFIPYVLYLHVKYSTYLLPLGLIRNEVQYVGILARYLSSVIILIGYRGLSRIRELSS